MKILLVLPVNSFPSDAGDSIHIYNLCKAWASSGHSTHVVTLKSKQQKKVFEQKDGIFIHRLPFTFSIPPERGLNFESLKNVIKIPLILMTSLLYSLGLMLTNEFDLFFVRYRPPFSTISLLLNFLTRKQLIIKFAGTAVYSYLKLPLEKQVFKLFIRRSSFLITDNSYMLKVFNKMISHYKIKNIQPPVSLDLFSNLSENRFCRSKKFTVLYVSSFRNDEEVTKFVLASSIVLRRFPDISFIMVGDGAKKAATVRLCERLGVKNNFTFLGSVPHNLVPHLLVTSDLLVALYSPKYKAIPLKILEYGASRKPIITTKNVASIFENELDTFKGKDNFCVVDSDVRSIANGLVALYEDEKLRNKIAKNMYNMTAENFSLDVISNKYLGVFKEALIIPSRASRKI